jgi:anti-anti-sigma factor
VAIANKLAHADTFAFSHSRGSDGTVRLTVSGEVDIYAAPLVREAIESILADPSTTDLMVDVADVDYIDCSAVSALITGRRLAQQHGIRFAVANPHGQVLRVLTVLRLDQVLAPGMQHCV